MGPYKPIDFTLFKCEVFSPDGTLLKEARMNSKNDFFCSGLVPGQEYLLVFSYDGILIECLSFNGEASGRVVYLSPAHIIFNKDISIPPHTFINSVKGKIKKRYQYGVPHMRWAKKALDVFIASTHESSSSKRRKTKHALDAFIESTHEGAKKVMYSGQVIAFKAGAALAKSVK